MDETTGTMQEGQQSQQTEPSGIQEKQDEEKTSLDVYKRQEWQQVMADVFDIDVVIPNVLEEATSMGAAVAAGVGVGAFEDFTAIDKFLKRDSVVKPIAENVEVYKKMYPIFNNSYNALVGVYKELADL